jgi:SSS family solute:Na+ symporter
MDNNGIVMIVCGAYFLTMVGTGIYAAKRNKKASDYLVAGRGLNTLMTAVTMAAVQIGVGIVLGSATNGYNMGIWPGLYYTIGCGGGLIFAGLVTAKKLRSNEGYVPIDFFAYRYNDSKAIRFWAWLSNVPSLLGIFIAQMLACGGILSGIGLPFGWGVVISAGVVLIYCTIGGMWGVVLTDVIQTTVIMIGIPIFFIFMVIKFVSGGGSVAEIYQTAFIPQGLFTRFVYLVLPFLLSISMSYYAYARIQAAKDVKAATRGCIVGGIIVIFIGGLCSSIGAMAVRLFPGVTDGIFTVAATGSLPPVLAGLVIAAILSAAMSSANCVILSLGSCFARDFYNKFLHPEVNNLDELPKAKRISQATVFIGSLAGILFAFKMTNILDAMIIFNYPYMGSLLIPLLGGLVWKGATRKGAFAAIVTGGIIGVGAFFLGIPGPLNGLINTDLALLVAYIVSGTTLYVVSVTDKKGQADNAARLTA